MASTIRGEGTQHWAGKALSHSKGKWLKRALGAAQKRDRSTLVSGLAGARQTPETLALIPVMKSNLDAVSSEQTIEDLFKGARKAFFTIYSTTLDRNSSILLLMENLTSYGFEGYTERLTDTIALTADPEVSEQVFSTNLWHGEVPEPYANLSRRFFDHASGTPWEFWAVWYEGMLNGKPLDWELQRRVALIDESVWDTGPEAVAEEIAEIRARWEVEKALSDIKGNLSVRTSARHGIGGNNPPESIEDERLSGAITLIWEATEDLSTALEEERPAREWIESILGKLKAGLFGLLKWCVGKANLAVGTVIVVGSTKGTTAIVDAYIANHPEKIEALIKAIEDWLPFLS